MRESFVFYRSFFEAISKLDDKKRLKMYDLISNFALNSEEIDTKYEICEQLFTLIKPQLVASHKHYEDGKKGGRPKKIKNPPFENIKSNENVNENENENENENVNASGFFVEENFEKKLNPIDPILNPNIQKCFDIYKQECKDLPELGYEPRNKQLRERLADFLNETDCDIGYFREVCRRANKLRYIANKLIDFKSLLNNHIGIYNGKYEEKEQGFDYGSLEPTPLEELRT